MSDIKSPKSHTEVLAQSDKFNNTLYLKVHYEDNVAMGCSVYLKLKSEERQRKLGNIYFFDRSFHVTRDSSKHFHYKTKSYGFNWTIINDAELNIKIVHLIVDKKEKYIIPKTVLDTYGIFLNFKEQGFELQKFLPLDMIKNFKDESYE